MERLKKDFTQIDHVRVLSHVESLSASANVSSQVYVPRRQVLKTVPVVSKKSPPVNVVKATAKDFAKKEKTYQWNTPWGKMKFRCQLALVGQIRKPSWKRWDDIGVNTFIEQYMEAKGFKTKDEVGSKDIVNLLKVPENHIPAFYNRVRVDPSPEDLKKPVQPKVKRKPATPQATPQAQSQPASSVDVDNSVDVDISGDIDIFS